MPEWLWSIVVGVVVVGLVAALRHADQSRTDERIEDIMDQMGRDSQSGMRKSIHDNANAVSSGVLALRLVETLEKRVESLEKRLRR